MRTIAQGMWDWFSYRAHTNHAKAWLAILSFSESSVFVVPPEILLVPMLAADKRQWLKLTVITVGSSIAGAVFGYIIAYFFFETIGERIISFYHLSDQFDRVGLLFEDNSFWVMFTAAFTPIPFKVFVLAAGFFKINFVMFIIASILGRGMRYLAIAYVAKRYGARATELCLQYANTITVIVIGTIVVVGLFLVFS